MRVAFGRRVKMGIDGAFVVVDALMLIGDSNSTGLAFGVACTLVINRALEQ